MQFDFVLSCSTEYVPVLESPPLYLQRTNSNIPPANCALPELYYIELGKLRYAPFRTYETIAGIRTLQIPFALIDLI